MPPIRKKVFIIIIAAISGLLLVERLYIAKSYTNMRSLAEDSVLSRTAATTPTRCQVSSAEDEVISRDSLTSETQNRIKQRKQALVDSCNKLDHGKISSYEEFYLKNTILKTSLFYSDKHKILFCSIPKCATRSQANFLANIEGIIDGKLANESASEYIERRLSVRNLNVSEVAKRIKNYTKFIIVREPFSRLLSAFRDKLERKRGNGYYVGLSHRIHAQYGNGTGNETGITKTSLQDFVEYLTAKRDNQQDPHWNYYYRLCSPCDIQYDYIAHMSTLDTDMEYFMKQFRMKNVVFPPSFNSFTDGKKVYNYFSNVSASSVNLLYHRYKTDYDIFGFSPPPQF
ncbi:carbohydrate sulfotransferase 10-like isoform X1 [Styela clava]